MPQASSPDFRSSLARATLLSMGARIALVIVLTTLVSYLHILRSTRTESFLRLVHYVSERSQREQSVFVLAENNHALLKKALEERILAWRQQDPDARFNSLFVRLEDGSIRNRPQGFDGTRMPGVFVSRGVTADVDFRRRLLAAHDVVAQYGPALRASFTDTYVILPEGAEVVFWPEDPDWCQKIAADFPLAASDFFTLSQPGKNPRRETVWTGIFEDVPSKRWMVSGITPLDMEGRHIATVGHDVLLDELMARTLHDQLPGAYNLIFRDDGQLIVHPQLKRESGMAASNLLDAGRSDAHLRTIYERVRGRQHGQTLLKLAEYDEYIAVARLAGSGWNFVTVLSGREVSTTAFHAARYVPFFGMVSLLVELAIMFWVLRRKITRPLLAFTRAATQVEAGDFHVELDTSRDDELGQLAQAFQRMAQEVHRREEALRHANEWLEHRVEERTRELKDVHQRLVDTARRAGMAEVATHVLHNVGNVLNSVTTSAHVARERLDGLRLEQVGRVVGLLEENQPRLARFLTEDERGKNVVPFLRRLSRHMSEEQQALRGLLEDVSRYTDHIATIVTMQQRHARSPQLQESVSLAELVEDALRISSTGPSLEQVQVERRLAAQPPVMTDRHKVLMILVNLISNASNAMDTLPVEQRRLSVTLEGPTDGLVRIQVRDNGVGIAPELLTRIFHYGFSTREDGHGFGLHSSALAAEELGGSLRAHSDGPGQGATFTLVLPSLPAGKR
ncbi:histidine kinase/DNA gyrase B/HSP90-like ATPase [Archangium gephyra]|uniref:histidine kinase n=1 Tax=Archangium gephyra TaxID=48 RepID=A0AAC8QCX9_9BACT|nr:ATP-binding protein [Archangium gephyra]AKJ05074.1 sensor histidine kinase [Archangium gephyra]REG35776.1 histidine kinase/DNA gyrase B/HSP90-like ATPase [Archangium gephyra]